MSILWRFLYDRTSKRGPLLFAYTKEITLLD